MHIYIYMTGPAVCVGLWSVCACVTIFAAAVRSWQSIEQVSLAGCGLTLAHGNGAVPQDLANLDALLLKHSNLAYHIIYVYQTMISVRRITNHPLVAVDHPPFSSLGDGSTWFNTCPVRLQCQPTLSGTVESTDWPLAGRSVESLVVPYSSKPR